MAPAGMSPHEGSARPTSAPVARVGPIDALRGLALAGMVVFHTAWDLNYWGWTQTGPAQSFAWTAFGHGIASSFLFVSGLCLVLARAHGTAAALRRIALLAGTAGLITATTLWLFPGEFIFFGIIHCIAAANLIGFAVSHAPAWVALLGAGLALMAPSLFTSSGLDGPVWWCLGLSPTVPPTLDYRPLLPWLAAVLCGIAAARLMPLLPVRRSRVWRWGGLAWAGRHSLLIYVAHQPLLFGVFLLAATVHPGRVTDDRSAFSRQCEAECIKAGAGRAGCVAACACMLDHLQPRPSEQTQQSSPSSGELRTAGMDCLRASSQDR